MTIGKVSAFVSAHSLINGRVCIFSDEDTEAFLRLVCEEGGGVRMIVWYEYCRAGEQKLGAGGWRDSFNEGFMWAETQLFGVGLNDKTPQEIMRYIADFRGEHSFFVLYPEFYI